MRPSPTARIALGAALIGAVVAIALALAQDGAEAPDRIDYFGDADTDDCTVEGAIGPHICLTDAAPTPTADTRDQRVELLSDPRLATIVTAAESADIDALLKMTLKFNLCEQRFREPIKECVGEDYVEAVQLQQFVRARPALSASVTMHEWLTNLFADGSSRLDLAVRSLPDGDLPPDAHVLIFKLPGRASLTEVNGGDYGYLVIYIRLDAPQPVAQFSFLSWRSNPSEFLLESLDLAPISYELVLGQCHPDDRFHCE